MNKYDRLKPIILCVSGGINSGKTTVSKKLADKLSWKKISFGDYVRHVAIKNDMTPSRLNCQELGAKLINIDHKKFCNDVLTYGNWNKNENAIIDGIRHTEILKFIKNISYPSLVYLIYIDTDLRNRINRNKNLKSKVDFKILDSHSTEKQVFTMLKNISDLNLNGHEKPDVIVSKIIQWYESKFPNTNFENRTCSNPA